MGETTKISWTDHTFNGWIGCTKVSPGCDNCYAETLNSRWGKDNWGKGKPRRTTADSNWHQPLKWDREAADQGIKAKVFCGSLCDVMDDESPHGMRERLWALIDHTPNLIWQLLTKRPHRYERYLPYRFVHDNVWLGTSAENQQFYDARWPILGKMRERCAAVFISYEPALGPVRMTGIGIGFPDWIIFGGESGNERRPMEQKWAEDIKAECELAGARFFMKQMSARTPEEGSKLIPAHLLVRQYPE